MVVYRVDLLDEEGKISVSGSLVYPNDRAVLRAAAKVIGHHQAVEVWDHTRVVGQLAARDCERLEHWTARLKPKPRPTAAARTAMTG
jgi:DNA-binding transcriptional regulator/RsmH inhibitor MraZ